MALRFYQQLKETLLKEVWKSEGHRLKTNGYALFMKKNFHVFTPRKGKLPTSPALQIGIGRRQDVNNMTHSIDPDDKVTLQWDDNSGSPSAKATNRLIVVVLYGTARLPRRSRQAPVPAGGRDRHVLPATQKRDQSTYLLLFRLARL